ncbi:MAG: TonB-dependent receptor [Woeseia sp.]
MKQIQRTARPEIAAGVCAAFCLGAVPIAVAQDELEEERHHQIDEITVSATPLSRTVEQLAQPTSVLSGEELALRQSTSIGETVSAEVGVSSTYFGPVASRPVIRGQYGERILVLSNGLDALDASALSEDHQVSVEGILAERVEIVRGPATLLYGSGAAGGIVNVVDNRIIDTPLTEPFSGAIALGADSAVGKRGAAGRVAFGSESFGLHLDYFRRDTDDVEIPGFAESALLRSLEEEHEEGHEEEEEAFGRIDNTDSETDGGALGLSWTGDRGFLGASLSTFNSNYGIPGHLAHEEDEDELPPAETGHEDESVRVDLEQRRLDLRGEHDFDGIISRAKFSLARSDYEHQEIEGGEIGTRFDTKGTDARLELRHADIGRWQGAFGLQFKRMDFDAFGEEAFVPRSDTLASSVFLFEEFALNNRWTLQTSARAERQKIDVDAAVGPEYSDTAFGASIGAIWDFTQDMSLAANYALTERHPNSTELFADGPHVAVNRFERGSVTLGEGFLGKELSSNLDLTLRGRNERLEWSITAFVNDVDDYILLSAAGEEEDGLAVFDYAQRDARFYGYEAETRIELLDTAGGHMHARLFSDYVLGEEKASGAYAPRLPPLRYGAGLHYVAERLSLGVDTTFHARQNKTAPNELPTDSYALVGADLSYALEEQGLFLFIRGTNLTDEDARQHSSPLKDSVPLPGRSFHVGLRYDF